jgi:hypothetical protein
MDEVYIEWGIMMGTCHISLMEGDNFGPTLMFARGDNPGDRQLGTILNELVGLNKQRISLTQLHTLLPPVNSITWVEELKVGPFSSCEIRGKGDDFKAFIVVKHGGEKSELDENKKNELLRSALSAKGSFFP